MDIAHVERVNASSPPRQQHQPLTPEERACRITNRLCLYCAQPGYFTHACPTRPSVATTVIGSMILVGNTDTPIEEHNYLNSIVLNFDSYKKGHPIFSFFLFLLTPRDNHYKFVSIFKQRSKKEAAYLIG